MADAEGQGYYRRQRGPVVKDAAGNEIRRPLLNRFMRASGKRYDGAYPGTFPLVGTPDDIVSDMQQMSIMGLAGTSVAFLDYLKEIPFFVQEVLPRLARLGLRREE
jgi:alkanesulfonate monooxygenase SsuD/methylene tetrahydromethanopterin reductase-like flavin-dependent oxidoreductase (luciferase family)